jgi:hypothetical protein
LIPANLKVINLVKAFKGMGNVSRVFEIHYSRICGALKMDKEWSKYPLLIDFIPNRKLVPKPLSSSALQKTASDPISFPPESHDS